MKRIATALEHPPQRETPDPGCQQGKDDRNSDLCAQWKAADAAKESADWTRRTFWLAIVGTLIGGLTLGAAGYAAAYAKAAAEAATATLEHGLNAVLHIESVDLNRSDGFLPPQIRFEVRNVGELPAKNFKVVGSWGYRGDLEVHPLTLHKCNGVPHGVSQGQMIHVSLPPSERFGFPRHGPLFCQFELTWENKGHEERHIREIHRSDGGEFSLLRDY